MLPTRKVILVLLKDIIHIKKDIILLHLEILAIVKVGKHKLLVIIHIHRVLVHRLLVLGLMLMDLKPLLVAIILIQKVLIQQLVNLIHTRKVFLLMLLEQVRIPKVLIHQQ